MNRKKILTLTAATACWLSLCGQTNTEMTQAQQAQTTPAKQTGQWTLDDCIRHALANNISLKKTVNAKASAAEDVKQARAALLPSLSASTNHSIGYRPWVNDGVSTVTNGTVATSINKTYYNGSYGINANWTVWNGNQNFNTLKLNKLTDRKAQEALATSREAVNKAQTNLGYATITSPIDGVVLSKAVEEGQTVAASFSTPELFTIAQNLTDMRVIADVDEADIGGVKEGERVTFTVDAYPDDVFEGEVTQVRQEATTTNNVVTYEVVISAPNAELKLKPGLTANVTIYTAEKQGVLAVTQKALRFTPTAETVGKQYKITDCKGKNKVWILNGNTFTARQIQTGMSDGTNTEIVSGVKEGETIVTALVEIEEEKEPVEQSPFAPGPKRNDKKK